METSVPYLHVGYQEQDASHSDAGESREEKVGKNCGRKGNVRAKERRENTR